MRKGIKKIVSLVLVFSMLLGFIPAGMKTASAEALAPRTENGITTFSYQGNENTKTVNLAGEMNEWNTSNISLTKGENYLFTTQQRLEPGKYQYKFIIDGEWMPDPNLEYIVEGLKINSESVVKLGGSLDLAAEYVNPDGSVKDVKATYSLENAVDGISVEDGKLVVSENAKADKVSLVAEFDGKKATKEITILSTMFTYTINYKRADNAQMNWDMWVFGNGLNGYAEAFTEEVDGYARATFELPISEISVITRPKNWDSQEMTRVVTVPEGKTSVEAWVVSGDENVYYSKPGDDSEPAKTRKIQFNYDRSEKDYDGWNLWYWSTGLVDSSDKVALNDLDYFVNGKLDLPISKGATNVGFIVRKSVSDDNRWTEKDPNKDLDRVVETDPNALEITTKVFLTQGQDAFRVVPYLKGPEYKDGNISFYYRDIDLYEADKMDAIDSVKINISKRNVDTKEMKELGSFEMTYSSENQRFGYVLENPEEGFDYVYTFDVTKDGETKTGLLDVSNTVDGESYQRLVSLDIGISASLNMKEAKAGESFVVTIDVDNPQNHGIKEIYIDGTNLGQNKIGVPVDLLKQNVALPLDLKAGEKTFDVVLVDEYNGTHKTTLKLDTLASSDTKDTIAWDEEIIYFLLTDRFFDGDSTNNDPAKNGSYDPSAIDAYHGGDFQGIIDKVDYLKQLGITTVWITPIVDNIENNLNQNGKSYGYHGYWAEDFTKIEPRLGDVDTLKKLIDTLHDNGIKLMVDVVLNHSGYETKNKGQFEGMHRTQPGTDDLTSELSGLPDFITENPEISKKLVKWQSEWLNTLRTDKGNTIDYFRIDTVKHVEHDTWKELKTALVEIKPDFKMIGEFYGGSTGNTGWYLGGGQMDSLLDFEFKSLAEKFVKGDIANIEKRLAERNKEITFDKNFGSFLSSHDEDGFLATRIGGNASLLKVASSLQITAKGQPVIYYGEEIGMSAPYAGNQNRKSFDWSKVENNDVLKHYQKITNIRKEHAEVFARGDRKSLYTDENVSIFSRTFNGETVIVGLNISNEAKSVTFPMNAAMGDALKDIFNEDAEFEAEDGKITVTIPANKDGGTAVFLPSQTESTTVIFNFKDPDNGEWAIWAWPKDGNGAQYEFTRQDGDVKIAEITFPGKVEEIGFIIKGKNDWAKNFDGDRFVYITKNPQNVYIESGKEEFTTDGVMLPRIEGFNIDSFREANIILNTKVALTDILDDYDIAFGGNSIKDKVESITPVSGDENASSEFLVKFKEDLAINGSIKINFTITQNDNDGVKADYPLEKSSRIAGLFDTPEFEKKYAYDGELGAIYSKLGTEFKIWAPTANKVDLVIFDDLYEEGFKTYPMESNEKGVYNYKLPGDQLGKAYMFDVHFDDVTNRVVDPYAKSVTINGQRGVVVNPKPSDVSRLTGKDATNPIIYELHIRDLSIAENSGIKNKGKFLGLTELGTKSPSGQITGLDYIKSLGVTHIQLIPIYDYSKYSVDETKLDTPQFNWGYDPVNYNSIEGSYSTDPANPFNRIEELQKTIDTIHQNGMGVIMDVVYNHVAGVDQHSFDYIVPGYYFRQDAKGNFLGGTGVGNETASERKMMQKFIIDSITYLAETYKFDGFRFDLMGTHDVETMNLVYRELVKINPNIFILGEGWNMGMGIPEDIRATQKNAYKMPEGIAHFSDNFRDGVKGSVFNGAEPGFVNGQQNQEDYILQNIKGGKGLQGYTSARQVIQYVEAHDNLTLWDKLLETNPNDSDETRLKMHKMATSMVLLSQGTPFIHTGQEFARTKGGDHNSYKSPDSVNQIDWDRALKFADNVEYFRELVKIRKLYPVFDLKSYDEIDAVYKEIATEKQLVAYKLDYNKDEIYIGYNAARNAQKFAAENGKYKVLVRDQVAKSEGIEEVEIKNGEIEIAPLSTILIVKDKPAEVKAGWVQNGDYWNYYDKDGSQVKSSWRWAPILDKEGNPTAKFNWKYFDAKGNNISQIYTENGSSWLSVAGPTNQYHRGWWTRPETGSKYFFRINSGSMVKGRQFIDGDWMFFRKSGTLVLGWQFFDGHWNFLDKNTGHQAISEWKWAPIIDKNGKETEKFNWKYFNSKGYSMDQIYTKNGLSCLSLTGPMKQYHKGWWTNPENGYIYFFRLSSGTMVKGEQFINGAWRFFRKSGTMATGWQKVNGKWKFYRIGTGTRVTGRQWIDGKWYEFDKSGAVIGNRF
ncbi:type I pullulanase [Helcococcus kunzii]|uniref:type I pullulanase n=1 Tax=Helcococcus kunzii TaxID=40091 RepID=UPI0021A58882|nr:type I pullulanase [Helcococcus kunzii]MCT1796019.1 type I pullulanase [Helcococcus kunzii]MCT1988205.1 type I pullulanase [Helcococcus kunzii]